MKHDYSDKMKDPSPQETVTQLLNLYNQGQLAAVVEQAQVAQGADEVHRLALRSGEIDVRCHHQVREGEAAKLDGGGGEFLQVR